MVHALRAALRPTFRDAKRHWWRTLLAVLLVALPVGIAAYSSTLEATRTQHNQAVGQDNIATYQGGTCEQDISGRSWDCQGQGADVAGERARIESALPAGFNAVIDAVVTGSLQNAPNSGDAEPSRRTAPALVAISAPATIAFGEHAPREGEIALAIDQATALGAHTGDALKFTFSVPLKQQDHAEPQVLTRSVDLTVSSTIGAYSSVTIPGTVLSEAEAALVPGSRWVLSGPRAMQWQDVQALNQAGFVVTSEAIIANPPPESERYPSFPSAEAFSVPWQEDLLFTVVALGALSVAALLILLVVAPVFAVNAARQSETYARMRTQGASPRHIRIAVLGYGLLAGVIGGALGLIGGVAAAALYSSVKLSEVPLALHVPTLALGFLAAVVGALVASYLPAWISARASLSRVAGGGRVDRMRRWRWWMALGPASLALLVLGAAITAQGWLGSSPWALLLLASPITLLLLLLSLIASVPAMILASASVRSPVTLKLAATLMRRQMLRSASALAAIAAVVFASTVVFGQLHAESRKSADVTARAYNTAAVAVRPTDLPTDLPADLPAAQRVPTAAVDAVAAVKTPRERLSLSTFPGFVSFAPRAEQHAEPSWSDAEDEVADPPNDPSVLFLRAATSNVIVADAAALELFALSTEEQAAATKALQRGALLVSRDHAEAGKRTVYFGEYEATPSEKAVEIEVAAVLPPYVQQVLLTPGTANALGLNTQYDSEVLLFDAPVPHADFEQMVQRVRNADPNADLSGYQTKFSAADRAQTYAAVALLLLFIIAITAVLSLHDMRRMQRQLASIGASPIQLRLLGGYSLGVLAGLGVWIPMLLANAYVWLQAEPTATGTSGQVLSYGLRTWVTPDWIQISILALAVPLLVFGCGVVLGRGPQAPQYRVD